MAVSIPFKWTLGLSLQTAADLLETSEDHTVGNCGNTSQTAHPACTVKPSHCQLCEGWLPGEPQERLWNDFQQSVPKTAASIFLAAAFLLTVRSFLLTVELFYLQLTILAFPITIGAFSLTILASLLAIGAFVLTVGKCV